MMTNGYGTQPEVNLVTHGCILIQRVVSGAHTADHTYSTLSSSNSGTRILCECKWNMLCYKQTHILLHSTCPYLLCTATNTVTLHIHTTITLSNRKGVKLTVAIGNCNTIHYEGIIQHSHIRNITVFTARIGKMILILYIIVIVVLCGFYFLSFIAYFHLTVRSHTVLARLFTRLPALRRLRVPLQILEIAVEPPVP